MLSGLDPEAGSRRSGLRVGDRWFGGGRIPDSDETGTKSSSRSRSRSRSRSNQGQGCDCQFRIPRS